MATLTSILSDKETTSVEKIASLAAIITDIRKEYGNSDIEITVPYVNTPDGMVSLKYLDADSKVSLAGRCVNAATTAAVEACEDEEGRVFDKEVERILACSPILCNLTAVTGSKYI